MYADNKTSDRANIKRTDLERQLEQDWSAGIRYVTDETIPHLFI